MKMRVRVQLERDKKNGMSDDVLENCIHSGCAGILLPEHRVYERRVCGSIGGAGAANHRRPNAAVDR